DHSGDGSAPEVYINPEILKRERYGLVEERCLSVPGVVAHVLRATRIVVRAQKVDGSPFESTLSDMPAVCLQHELDHFDGKLVVDRLNWFKRRRLRKALVQQGVDLASA
ncbi:MAG: peptide deformylase, partial [Pseudomonadota bacterium]